MKSLHRRSFLASSLAGSAVFAAGPLASLGAQASTLGGSDYRALVCVFLFGGNDGNNMIVPLDASGYARYAKARGNSAAGGLALEASSLAPLAGSSLGLHPGLAPLADLWNQGHLAVQANVGTLVAPMTKAQYLANAALRPPSLFSHIDQQMQWQHGASGPTLTSGWGGRAADLQAASTLPTVMSFSGNSAFINGARTQGLVLPPTGSFMLRGFGNTPASNPIYNLYARQLQAGSPNVEIQAADDVIQQAMMTSSLLNPVLSATPSTAGLFNGIKGTLAQQLLAVAKVIEARNSLAANRQIFFVSLGGFDTHNDQLARQDNLFGQLGPALKAFHDAMVQLGLAGQVTTFTASDFARTLQPASGGGSDHAWGSHHLIIGGAVRRGVYGRMPDLTLGGPDDVTSEGRWLPSTSVDQMGATLASWLGVSAADLATVFPNLTHFGQKNMGYFG
ncbi:MAG: DUF1501 domain-containing protein [Burkholderiales bacterium]|nr:MAG: DUF1501 domain-containing protein [Burkholderiales bacterium]